MRFPKQKVNPSHSFNSDSGSKLWPKQNKKNDKKNSLVTKNLVLESGALAEIQVEDDDSIWFNKPVTAISYIGLISLVLISLAGIILCVVLMISNVFGIAASDYMIYKACGAAGAIIIFAASLVLLILFACSHGKETNWCSVMGPNPQTKLDGDQENAPQTKVIGMYSIDGDAKGPKGNHVAPFNDNSSIAYSHHHYNNQHVNHVAAPVYANHEMKTFKPLHHKPSISHHNSFSMEPSFREHSPLPTINDHGMDNALSPKMIKIKR